MDFKLTPLHQVPVMPKIVFRSISLHVLHTANKSKLGQDLNLQGSYFSGGSMLIVDNGDGNGKFKTTLTSETNTTTSDCLEVVVWMDTPMNKPTDPGMVVGCKGCRFHTVSLVTRPRPPTDNWAHFWPGFWRLVYVAWQEIGKCTILHRHWCNVHVPDSGAWTMWGRASSTVGWMPWLESTLAVR